MSPGFRRQPELDELMRLRRSGNPEDHRRLDTAMTASRRMSLGYYEATIRAHIAAGGELPDGVLPP